MPDDLDQILSLGSGAAALLYLYRKKHPGPINTRHAMRVLGWSEGELKIAFVSLVGVGLARSADLPNSDAISPAELMQDLSAMVAELQRRLGKILSTRETGLLQTMFYQMGMPQEVILLLYEYCTLSRRYAAKDIIPAMKAEAERWLEQGITTAATAEAHLQQQQRLYQRFDLLLPRLGLTAPALKLMQESYLKKWIGWGFTDDAIVLATERCRARKQELNFAYCNGILDKWEKKNLFTVPAIEEHDSPAANRTVEDDITWMRDFLPTADDTNRR